MKWGQKIKDYDRKRAAAYRLKKKLESEKRTEGNNARKRKSSLSKEIPTDVKQFKRLVTKICKVGIKSEANEWDPCEFSVSFPKNQQV